MPRSKNLHRVGSHLFAPAAVTCTPLNPPRGNGGIRAIPVSFAYRLVADPALEQDRMDPEFRGFPRVPRSNTGHWF